MSVTKIKPPRLSAPYSGIQEILDQAPVVGAFFADAVVDAFKNRGEATRFHDILFADAVVDAFKNRGEATRFHDILLADPAAQAKVRSYLAGVNLDKIDPLSALRNAAEKVFKLQKPGREKLKSKNYRAKTARRGSLSHAPGMR